MDAVAIQSNHISYAECGGRTISVPCGEGTNVDVQGDYWGQPIKDKIFRGYRIVAKAPGSAAPTPDSISLVRIYDKYTGNTYHLLGTAAQYRTACGGGAAMPLATTIPLVVPTVNLCAPLTKGGTDFNNWWTPPAKTGGQTYTVAVDYNNTQPVAPGTGLADVPAVVTYLNTNYAAVGTWSNDAGRVKLVRSSAAVIGLAFKVV